MEDTKEIFKELKDALEMLDDEMRERFYSYLKALLVGSGYSVIEVEEAVKSMEEKGLKA